jgi:pimeloyl-ACP methyl ester carboxylesterase
MSAKFGTKEFRISLDHGYSLFACEVTRHLSAETSSSTAIISPKEESAFVVIVVHGGPGLISHKESFDGLKNLLLEWHESADGVGKGTCETLHAIVFYDQLGCGASEGPPVQQHEKRKQHDHPKANKQEGEPSQDLYSLSYYVKELQQVIEIVKQRHGKPRICILGHSWGGQIVLELLLTQPSSGVNCAVVSNAPLNEATYAQRQLEIRNELPEDVRQFIEEDEQQAANDTTVGAAVYRKLIGTSDTNVVGELKEWDALQRIHFLSCPCLMITGTHDTIPHKEYEQLQKSNPITQAIVLQNGDHAPFYGDTANQYFREIQGFLQRNLSSSS